MALVAISCCTACGGHTAQCPPSSAARAAALTATADLQPAPTRVNILIDGSGSMSGYFSAGEAGNHYRDLLHELRQDLQEKWGKSLQVTFSRFGREITPLTGEDEAHMTLAKFYTHKCSTALGKCDVDQSLIGVALEYAEQRPHDELTLICTDLFLTDDEKLPGGVRSIKQPLFHVLSHGGRAIGLLGFETPFEGLIYELPGRPNYLHKPVASSRQPTTRPVFVLLIGRARHILDLRQALHGPFLADLQGHEKFAFYNADWPLQRPDLAWSAGKGVRVLESIDASGGSSFAVSAPAYEPLTAEIADATFKERYGASFDHFTTRESLSTEHGNAACPSSERFRGVSPLVSAQASANALRVRIFTDAVQIRHLPASNRYSLDVDILADSLRPTPAVERFDEWNLDPAQVELIVRKHPSLFPALNLTAVTDYLDQRTREQFKPLIVAHTTIHFRVEK